MRTDRQSDSTAKPLARKAPSLFGDAAAAFAMRLGAAVVVYLTHVVLARWMGAGELGIAVHAMAWLWLASSASTLGLGQAVTRFVPSFNAHDDVAGAVACTAAMRRLAGIASVALAAVAVVIALAWSERPATWALTWLALPLTASLLLNGGVARAWMRVVLAAATAVLARPLLFFAAIVSAWWLGVPADSETMMALLLLACLLAWLLQAGVMRWRAVVATPGQPRRATNAERREWLVAAWPMLLTGLFVNYFVDINVVLSAQFMAPEVLAVHNAALRTVGVQAFAVVAVGAALSPRAARALAAGDQPGLQRMAALAAQLMFWPALAAFTVMVVGGKLLLGLFGPGFVAGYEVLVIAGFGQLLVAALGPVLPLLNMAGHQKRCLVAFGVALLVTAGLTALLVPAMGMRGSAIAIVAAGLCWSVWLYAMVRRELGIDSSILAARHIARPASA